MSTAATAELFDVELPPSPYPGLRPFEQHEWPIFFGRETMTAEAITRLLDRNLLVVHGDSGCGKSSLIRAGVLVELEQRHARGDQRWRTCTMLPREAPLLRLAKALASLKEPEPSAETIRDFRRAVNAGRGAASKIERRLCIDPANRVCVLVDQFEELFRFAKETSPEEARVFVEVLVGLLEEAKRRREAGERLRVYTILTMRSEFLGRCARFAGLAETVNESQYLLPRMKRTSLLRAIREPATLYGGEVDLALAERLIADAGDDQDQLPLIQHGLMLMHREKVGRKKGQHWHLELSDYRGTKGLAGLLSSHADEVMAGVASYVARVEFTFRALTDVNAEGEAIRRPLRFSRLLLETGARKHELRAVLDAFRVEGVNFVTPSRETEIEGDTFIDISHEALIRCWHQISNTEEGWLWKEVKDGLAWRSLVFQAQAFFRDRRHKPSRPAIIESAKWLTTLPGPYWCDRYEHGQETVKRLFEDRARDPSAIFWNIVILPVTGLIAGFSLIAFLQIIDALRRPSTSSWSGELSLFLIVFGFFALLAVFHVYFVKRVVSAKRAISASRLFFRDWLGHSTDKKIIINPDGTFSIYGKTFKQRESAEQLIRLVESGGR